MFIVGCLDWLDLLKIELGTTRQTNPADTCTYSSYKLNTKVYLGYRMRLTVLIGVSTLSTGTTLRTKQDHHIGTEGFSEPDSTLKEVQSAAPLPESILSISVTQSLKHPNPYSYRSGQVCSYETRASVLLFESYFQFSLDYLNAKLIDLQKSQSYFIRVQITTEISLTSWYMRPAFTRTV